jgi:hypothetical protein
VVMTLTEHGVQALVDPQKAGALLRSAGPL